MGTDFEIIKDIIAAKWPPGPAVLANGATAAERRAAIRQVADNLRMSSLTAAVYHIKKHVGELTREELGAGEGDSENEKNVMAYKKAAQGAVRLDTSSTSPQAGQFGGESHFYRGGSMQTIVRTNDLKTAIIATCFRA